MKSTPHRPHQSTPRPHVRRRVDPLAGPRLGGPMHASTALALALLSIAERQAAAEKGVAR
jgi:hypothetical protein